MHLIVDPECCAAVVAVTVDIGVGAQSTLGGTTFLPLKN